MRPEVLRPLRWTWVGQVRSELDCLPHPIDTPRQSVAGPDPDRVLIWGNGASIGFGLTSYGPALPGQLAASLARRTGRGTHVDIAATRGTTIARAAVQIGDLPLERYDAVVVTLGASDALEFLPLRRWRNAVRAVLAELQRRTAPRAMPVVLGIPPVQRSPRSQGFLGDQIDAHARRMNDISAAVCNDLRMAYVTPPTGYRASLTFEETTERYRQLADRVAEALAPERHELADTTDHLPARRFRVLAAESDRQQALNAFALTMDGNDRIDSLVRRAKEAFGTRYAAVSIVDGDWQWNKATVGLPATRIPRSISLCARTIEQDRPLLIEDLAADEKTASRVVDAGLRFYVGIPIETPEGHRLGALCLLDDRPHEKDEIDLPLLQHFALRVQEELWSEAMPARHAEHTHG